MVAQREQISLHWRVLKHEAEKIKKDREQRQVRYQRSGPHVSLPQFLCHHPMLLLTWSSAVCIPLFLAFHCPLLFALCSDPISSFSFPLPVHTNPSLPATFQGPQLLLLSWQLAAAHRPMAAGWGGLPVGQTHRHACSPTHSHVHEHSPPQPHNCRH